MIEGALNNLFTAFEQAISFPLPAPHQQLIEFDKLYKIEDQIHKGIKVKSLRIKDYMQNFTDEIQLKRYKHFLAGDEDQRALRELIQS